MANPIKTIPLFDKTGKPVFAVLLASLFLLSGCYHSSNRTAVKGMLNLQNRNWAKDGIADMNGEWAFYWHNLYTPSAFDSAVLVPTAYANVPGFWNSLVPSIGWFEPGFGYATYRLKIVCPSSDEKLQLKFLTVASAYKIFVNGKQVGEVGEVGTNEATTTPAYQPAVFAVTPVNDSLDIIVQVANFNYSTGGLWDFIKLGTQQQIDNYRIRSISGDFFIAGSFFLISLFHLVIYVFFRRRLSPVYFALFCLIIGMRALVTGELGITYFTHWNWQFIKHIEFVFLYLTVPLLSLFSYELFPAEFSKKILRCILLISVPFVAAALFASPLLFRYTLRPFQLFMLLTAGYGWYVYIGAVKKKRTGSVYFLAGFVVLFIAIINDILYTSLIIESTDLLYTGLYILVICQAATLSRQFFRAYTKVEKLNTQLESANNELNTKNETIHETNVQLSHVNSELDTLVFRTSHDLRSPITSVYAMADLIKMEADTIKRNGYVDFQKKTLQRLDAIITDILQYSKNKSTSLQYEAIDLTEFVQHVLHDHLLADKSERIQRLTEVNQSAPFATDKIRLNMVLNNLFSNALKHHNKEQKAPFVKICVRANEQEAAIEVQDNGRGIEAGHLAHIFTKFYRVNSQSNGSGLGLYIVKDAVEKLGGIIRVESQVNVGTTFFIVIPNGVSK